MTAALTRRDLVLVLEAVEVLHAQAEGSFSDRVFGASRLLFADACHGFEVFGLHDGSHTISSDMPWPESRRAELTARAGEIVPREHPIFPLLKKGKAEPARLSDLISQSRLERTELFNEIFAPARTRYQIALPFASARYVGGLTINRGGRDYSERDLAMARLFSSHVLVAYRSDEVLAAARQAAPVVARFDHAHLRACGLTRREADVMAWVREGKHNDEIAIILAMSRRTVEKHMTSIFRKLDVDSRAAALASLFEASCL